MIIKYENITLSIGIKLLLLLIISSCSLEKQHDTITASKKVFAEGMIALK